MTNKSWYSMLLLMISTRQLFSYKSAKLAIMELAYNKPFGESIQKALDHART
jgi:hypothetical protein